VACKLVVAWSMLADRIRSSEDHARMAIGLRVPDRCRRCGVRGRVVFEHTITGVTAVLRWHCANCSYGWPVSQTEYGNAERRVGSTDGRTRPRSERRKTGRHDGPR